MCTVYTYGSVDDEKKIPNPTIVSPAMTFFPTKIILPLSLFIATVFGAHTEYLTAYEAPEPYVYLNDNCVRCNPPVEASPDPLVSMTWSDKTNTSQLQIYRIDRPVKFWVSPPGAADFVATRTTDSTTSGLSPPFSILVYRNCTVTLDWGVERAAWFELISDDGLGSNGRFQVKASISEYNEPYPDKTRSLTKYGNRTYRLETNPQLYEGVRFSFLHFDFFSICFLTIINFKFTALKISIRFRKKHYK